jgi:hypothetical protein
MDDGGKSVHNQTILHTRSFNKEEVEYLQTVLNKNFELRTRRKNRRSMSYLHTGTSKSKVKRYCRSIYA